jgi:hypothetical protein
MKIKKSDFTIGFEIECGLAPGVTSSVEKFAQDLGSDGTIDHSPNHEWSNHIPDDYRLVEIRTQPFEFGKQEYREFLDAFSDDVENKRIVMNDSCGLHFHVGYQGISGNAHEYLLPKKEFIVGWQNMVKEKYPVVWERRKAHSYCYAYEQGEEPNKDGDRYKAVNFKSLNKTINTIEFRLYSFSAGNNDFGTFERFVEDSIGAMFRTMKDVDMRKERFVSNEVFADSSLEEERICVEY